MAVYLHEFAVSVPVGTFDQLHFPSFHPAISVVLLHLCVAGCVGAAASLDSSEKRVCGFWKESNPDHSVVLPVAWHPGFTNVAYPYIIMLADLIIFCLNVL